MSKTVYPDREWERISPEATGMDAAQLEKAERYMADDPANVRYRIVVVRHGRLVAEWNREIPAEKRINLASAAKSVFSNILAIAVAEGKISSVDALLADYYPEAFDVPEGEGPKPGRYAFPKDRGITLRQLIGNTSGYMKPGEEPGKVFHYQTYGMNVLTHAIAKAYGLYDANDPKRLPGLSPLVDEKIAAPIGASFGYYRGNFDLHPKARLGIFGYYDGISATALDMARLGWLWCNSGRWQEQQVIPEDWLHESTRTSREIRANAPLEQWVYGYGYWVNDAGQLWPNLPRDSFAAQGAGYMLIWVCPSLDLVVVQSPGNWQDKQASDPPLLELIAAACKD
ncbi:MAG TPA: beta-lactamase family protein [Firmicutes bacterium]|nr:beta-lactamase family protein [Bacillota bacterium]